MVITVRNFVIVLPMVAVMVFAGAEIEFDRKDFDCGTVTEGTTNKINATFLVGNSGDSVLKLESVQPACGCTVVKYDSLVLPGKNVKIESEVDITGSRSGFLSKPITVISNAKNEPRAILNIDVIILPIIEVSEKYLSLDNSNITLPKTVMLATKKSDFKISGIFFRYGDCSGAAGSKPPEPLLIRYKLLPTDSTNSDGYHVFKLEVFSPEPAETVSGEFLIATNHTEKPELSLRGNIDK